MNSDVFRYYVTVIGCSFRETNNSRVFLQIITDYKSHQLPIVLDALERMHAHLTAAVVSNDPLFLQARFDHPDSGYVYSCLVEPQT